MRLRILGALILASPLLCAQTVRVKGKIESVTLFRGQAMVTRTLPMAAGTGSFEVISDEIPEHFVPGSLFAEGGPGLEVRAVNFRSMAVEDEPRDDLRALDASIQAVADQISANTKAQELAQRRTVSIDKLENFVAPTATTELSRGVLDAEQLQKLVMFVFDQRQQISGQLLTLEKEIRELNSKLSTLNAQRAEISKSTRKILREAVVFVEKREAAATNLRLSYLVSNCGWTPSYNLRGDGKLEDVDVEYNGLIQQMSGEDWAAVTLTLSTATPALNASGPVLAPFRVALAAEVPRQAAPADAEKARFAYRDILQKQAKANNDNLVAQSLLSNVQSAWTMNCVAVEAQNFELNMGSEVVRTATSDNADVEGPSLSYGLASPVSLKSRPDQQMVRIASARLKCKAYHVAIPILTPFVFREAELRNSSKFDFLGGTMNVYLDGRFVGRSEMITVAQGQPFVVGFGADAQLKTRRELVEKSEKVQGGNKITEMRVRIVLESFKEGASSVRVLDRIPTTERGNDVRITLGNVPQKLSEDPVYLRVERPAGILRWEVPVEGQTSADKAKILEYDYTIEHDRNFTLSADEAVTTPDAQREFERFLKMRNTR